MTLENKEYDLHGNEEHINQFAEALTCETEEEAGQLLQWAQQTSVNYAMVQSAMQGMITIGFKDGEPVFSMTDKGKDYVENMIGMPNWPDVLDGSAKED